MHLLTQPTIRRTLLLLSFFLLPGLSIAGEAPADTVVREAAKSTPKKAAKKTAKSRKKKKKRRRRRGYPTRRPKSPVVEPVLGPIPFPEGERLAFKLKMFGAEAADAILAVGKRTTYKGRAVVPLVGFLRSTPFLSKFYPIEDKIEVLVDEKTFQPLKSEFEIRENGKKIDYHTTFDQTKLKITSIREKKGRKLNRSFKPIAPIYDALTSIYGARRVDLQPGVKFSYYIWDGTRERFVNVEVIKKEKIWTPLGWSEAMRVEISSIVTGGFVSKKTLDRPRKRGTVWFGLDPNRTPLKVVTPTKLGQAEAVLIRRWVEDDASKAP